MSPDCETVPNYYELLGVPRDVSPEALNRAYREAALKNHPDRGGTHAAMKLVNEAYAILSNPARKAEYDRVLGQSKDSEMFADWVNQTQEVRERAADYPRQWAQFEKWMEGFVSDVQSARYDSFTLKFNKLKIPILDFSIEVPTVENSVSGCLFLIGGAVLSIWLLGFRVGLFPAVYRWLNRIPGETILDDLLSRIPPGPIALPVLLVYLVVPIGGMWAGTWLHQLVRESMPRHPNTSRSPRKSTVGESQALADVDYQTITCRRCGQKLRVPKLEKEMAVTCGKCGHKFSHGGPA